MTAAAGGAGRITIDEVVRRLDKVEATQERHHDDLVRRLESLSFVHPETFAMQMQLEAAHRDDMTRRIGDLEAADKEREREAASNRRAIALAFLASFLLPIASALLLSAVR